MDREMEQAQGKNESIEKSEIYRLGKEMGDLIYRLAQESQRSLVIVGTARLEIALEKALKQILRKPTGGGDSLFDPERPLSTFASKIAFAHRLGLITDEFEHALQMIRKIRNDFAHSIEDETLSNQRHANRIRDFLVDVKKSFLWEVMEEKIKDIEPIESCIFSTILAVMIGELEIATSINEPTVEVTVKPFMIKNND